MVDGEVAVTRLVKRYQAVTAVDELTFTVRPGRVTGFLGPNGAGKSTTLRMLLGLAAPTSGTATIGGVAYADLPDPVRTVGALLDADTAHPGRTGRSHLRVWCAAAGIRDARADEVLALVGLAPAGRRRFKEYSLGMRQRLGIAAALLGDPRVLILDEPANGLDPEGIRWLRGLLRGLAAEGRTVLVSSHLLAEVQQLADDVVIIAGGRYVTGGPMAEVLAGAGAAQRVLVRTADPAGLAAALGAAGASVTADGPGLAVSGLDSARVGEVAHACGAVLHELRPEVVDLERAFFHLTSGKAQIR